MSKTERGLYKRGNSWYINFFVNGRRHRESVGPNKQLAREILAKRRVQAKEGLVFDIKKDKVTTFEEMASDFLVYSKNNKRSYLRDTQLIANLKRFFNSKRLNDISISQIEAYKSQRLGNSEKKFEKTAKPATINRELACLKAMFNWAIKSKKASANPVRDVKFYRENNTIVRYLTAEEMKRLIDSCPVHFKPVVITALTTGMRLNEILTLKWVNLDLNTRIIHVEHTKSGKSRRIPVCDYLLETFQKCRVWTDGEHVFCNEKKKPYTENIRNMFLWILKKARIENFRFHDLRHTAASHMVMAGINLLTVKEILGHAKLDMTLRYAHLSPDYMKAAVEVLGNKIQEATATETATARQTVIDKVSESRYNYIANSIEF